MCLKSMRAIINSLKSKNVPEIFISGVVEYYKTLLKTILLTDFSWTYSDTYYVYSYRMS